MLKKKGYSKADLAEVMDNPQWTREEMRNARPFRELFPELAAKIRKARGPQKAPTKQLVSLRVDRDVIAKFKAEGEGWQSRMNAALRKAAGLK
jgi:uncharacterized protein (DUF4415 family)